MTTRSEILNIRERHPNYIPVVVTAQDDCIQLQNTKFLVKNDMTIGQLMFSVRKRSHINSNIQANESLFFMVNNKLPPMTQLVSFLYETEKNPKTEMLEVVVCKENTFGKK